MEMFTPCELPWALMGQALVGPPWALMGWALMGPRRVYRSSRGYLTPHGDQRLPPLLTLAYIYLYIYGGTLFLALTKVRPK